MIIISYNKLIYKKKLGLNYEIPNPKNCLGVFRGGDGESQAGGHAARIRSQGSIDEIPELGKIDDFAKTLV